MNDKEKNNQGNPDRKEFGPRADAPVQPGGAGDHAQGVRRLDAVGGAGKGPHGLAENAPDGPGIGYPPGDALHPPVPPRFRLPGGPRQLRAGALHPGDPRQHVPRQGIHDAPAHRLRVSRGHEQADQIHAGPWRHGSEHPLRHPDDPDVRLRRSPLPGAGGDVRGVHRFGRRHGPPFQGHPPGRDHRLHRHPLSLQHGHSLSHVPGPRRGEGHPLGEAAGQRPERHLPGGADPQRRGIHRAAGLLPDPVRQYRIHPEECAPMEFHHPQRLQPAGIRNIRRDGNGRRRGQRHRDARGDGPPGIRRGFGRGPPGLLLVAGERFLRRGGQAPGRSPALVQDHEAPVPGERTPAPCGCAAMSRPPAYPWSSRNP